MVLPWDCEYKLASEKWSNNGKFVFARKDALTEREVGGLAMRSAKTMTQDLITDVATKSNGDDLADIDVIILVTSLTAIVGMASKGSPTASSQQREDCRCGLLLTVEVPAKQVCSPVGDRCVQIMNDVCQQ